MWGALTILKTLYTQVRDLARHQSAWPGCTVLGQRFDLAEVQPSS
jgi:hypothetical protein